MLAGVLGSHRFNLFVGAPFILLWLTLPASPATLGRPVRMPLKIGAYSLGQSVSEAPGLTELTPSEYALFEAAGWKRFLPDERVYKGPDVTFRGTLWNLMVGATQGRIYKISTQDLTEDRHRSAAVFQNTLVYLIDQMGAAKEQSANPTRYMWDAPEGNVILEHLSAQGMHVVNLFLTSSMIRKR